MVSHQMSSENKRVIEVNDGTWKYYRSRRDTHYRVGPRYFIGKGAPRLLDWKSVLAKTESEAIQIMRTAGIFDENVELGVLTQQSINDAYDNLMDRIGELGRRAPWRNGSDKCDCKGTREYPITKDRIQIAELKLGRCWMCMRCHHSFRTAPSLWLW
ncbi:hypothetical protein CL642_01160 [bacterium]|nr:hypothetical protein [bacterium]